MGVCDSCGSAEQASNTKKEIPKVNIWDNAINIGNPTTCELSDNKCLNCNGNLYSIKTGNQSSFTCLGNCLNESQNNYENNNKFQNKNFNNSNNNQKSKKRKRKYKKNNFKKKNNNNEFDDLEDDE